MDFRPSTLGTDFLFYLACREDVFSFLGLILIAHKREEPCPIKWKRCSFAKQFPQDVVEFLSIYVIQFPSFESTKAILGLKRTGNLLDLRFPMFYRRTQSYSKLQIRAPLLRDDGRGKSAVTGYDDTLGNPRACLNFSSAIARSCLSFSWTEWDRRELLNTDMCPPFLRSRPVATAAEPCRSEGFVPSGHRIVNVKP